MNRNTKNAALLAIPVFLFTAAWLHAGPLSPPAGPIASTGRTLDEIFNKIPATGAADGRIPISTSTTITVPGSYVLTSNITVASGSAITIATSNVTLDLNGFTISGPATINSAGVRTSNTTNTDIVIRNGTVIGFQAGIDLVGTAISVSIEDMVIRQSKHNGILAASGSGKLVRVRRCSVLDTGATTTAADGNTAVSAVSIASGNALVEDTHVGRLMYFGSGTATFRGISLNNSSVVTGGGSIVQRCTVANDVALTGTGILVANPANVFRDNTVLLFSTPYTGGTNGGGNF